jgi:hypothetical protein
MGNFIEPLPHLINKTIVPSKKHFLETRNGERTDDAEAEPMGVGKIPEAPVQFGVLRIPIPARRDAAGGP